MNRFIVAMVLAGTACTSVSGESSPVVATVTDSAGVQIVNSLRAAWTQATQWTIDPTPVTTVGGDENDKNQHFTFPRHAIRLSNGNIVIDSDQEIRLFGVDGKYISTIARDGAGPGEFRSVQSLVRLPGDSIMITQAIAEGGMKAALLRANGAFIREERVDMVKYGKLGHWGECATATLPDRTRLACQSDTTIPVTATNRRSILLPNGMSSPGPGHLRQLRREFAVPSTLDTVYRLGVVAGIEQFGVDMGGGRTQFQRHPYYSRSLSAAGGTPLRIAMALNPQYSIEVWTPKGKLERIIRLPNGRRATSDEERKAAPEIMRKQMAQNPRIYPNPEALIAAIPTPDSMPAIGALVVADGGEIIVGRVNPPSAKASKYDVFDPSGKLLGELMMPGIMSIIEVGTDYVLATNKDDNDVMRVQAYRLHRGKKP